MTSEAIPIRRITAFVRWVARTPWPVFTLGMLQADIIGALLVLGFLRFGLPPEDRIQLQDLPAFNLAIFLGYLFLSFTIGSYLTLRMLIPVMRWQRRDTLLDQIDPAATEMARTRALKMPFYRSVINVTNWLLGSVVFIVASWPVASNPRQSSRSPPDWAPPRRRSSAICSPNGCSDPWPWPRCAAACRRTFARRG